MSDNDQIVGNKNIIKVESSPFVQDITAPLTLSFYSFDGTIDIEVPVDDELLAKMQGETIKYFYYRQTEDGQIELLNDAGEQDW